MKKKFFPLYLAVAFSTTAFAKENSDVTFGVYRWNTNAPITKCDRTGANPGSKIDAEAGQLFKVLDFVSDAVGTDDAIIQILDYTKKVDGNVVVNPAFKEKFYKYNFSGLETDYGALAPSAKNSRDYSVKQLYFRVSKTIIAGNASKQLGNGADLAVGILTLPLKMRLQDGDFTGSVSIAGTGGIKWRASKYNENYHNALLGLGISNISLDTNNVSKNKDKLISNLSALTFCVGYMYQTSKAQAGVFVGWDFLTHSNHEMFGWNYQGKPWVSLAFGMSIFGDGDGGKTNEPSSQGK